MSAGLIALIVVAAVVLLVVITVVAVYNTLVRLRNNVEEGYSTMDVYLKKRYDLIPNLVETVKGYAKHEKETFTNVIEARNMAMNANSVEDKVKNENILSGTLKSLFALSENYPALQANQNFMDLQQQLQQIESEIAQSRKYYNAVVKQFNNKIEVFPSNIIAGWFKFKRTSMFEVENAEEKKNVQVKF